MLFICKGPAMPCATMFLNLLSQGGNLTDILVLANAGLSPQQQTFDFHKGSVGSNALRHHGHSRLGSVIPDGQYDVKSFFAHGSSWQDHNRVSYDANNPGVIIALKWAINT
jgi:hypothetical protein